MNETTFVVEYRRASDAEWRFSNQFDSKQGAEKHFEAEVKRFPNFQHRVIRVSVLKESR